MVHVVHMLFLFALSSWYDMAFRKLGCGVNYVSNSVAVASAMVGGV